VLQAIFLLAVIIEVPFGSPGVHSQRLQSPSLLVHNTCYMLRLKGQVQPGLTTGAVMRT
jgi:hypothetical protein